MKQDINKKIKLRRLIIDNMLSFLQCFYACNKPLTIPLSVLKQ